MLRISLGGAHFHGFVRVQPRDQEVGASASASRADGRSLRNGVRRDYIGLQDPHYERRRIVFCRRRSLLFFNRRKQLDTRRARLRLSHQEMDARSPPETLHALR